MVDQMKEGGESKWRFAQCFGDREESEVVEGKD